MQCNRIKHFFRVNANGSFTCCGHMVNAREFSSYTSLQESDWALNISTNLSNNVWPDECVRCELSEQSNNESVRIQSNKLHKEYYDINPNYLILGGMLDNKCNSACQSCNANSSTLIGKLNHTPVKINNYNKILPYLDDVVQLDINGGEPTISNTYKKLLSKINSNASVRINTNAITFFSEIIALLENNRKVTVTMSLDGVGNVHDYVRWPAKWTVVKKVHTQYKSLANKYSNLDLNFWITLSALNIGNFDDIVSYASNLNIPYSYGILQTPNELNIKYNNKFTDMCINKTIKRNIKNTNNEKLIMEFVKKQDTIRNISYIDYYT
jgi:MoaA/NifB/PqqE/SkfB family radical SAM enzyme